MELGGKMKKILIALTAFLFINLALAQDENWLEYSKGTAGRVYLFHRGKIQAEPPNSFLVWSKQKNLKPTHLNKNGTGPLVYSITSQIRVNCSAKTLQVVSNVFYGKNGESISSGLTNSMPEPIVPDTVGENLADMVCF